MQDADAEEAAAEQALIAATRRVQAVKASSADNAQPEP
jgi:hypothetical protein